MRLSRFLPLALLALSFALPLRAGEVEPRHVAKDAKWFIHLDLDALKKTTTYANVMEAIKAQAPVEEMVGQIKAAVGVNPLTDIFGITVYNTSFEKDAATIIFYAKVDQFMLQQALANNPEYKQQAYGKKSIQTWTDANDGKSKAACFQGDFTVVLGNSVENVKAAVDVLDGVKPGGAAMVKCPAKGAFLYAAGYLADAPDQKFARLLSETEPVSASVIEDDNKLQVSASLVARNPEQAAQLKKAMDGLKAFAEIATGQDQPTASALLRDIKTTIDGAKVLASFQHDAKTLVETLKKLDEENKAKKSREEKAAKDPAAPKQ